MWRRLLSHPVAHAAHCLDQRRVLREKIEDDPQNPALIKTVRGMGYRMGE